MAALHANDAIAQRVQEQEAISLVSSVLQLPGGSLSHLLVFEVSGC